MKMLTNQESNVILRTLSPEEKVKVLGSLGYTAKPKLMKIRRANEKFIRTLAGILNSKNKHELSDLVVMADLSSFNFLIKMMIPFLPEKNKVNYENGRPYSYNFPKNGSSLEERMAWLMTREEMKNRPFLNEVVFYLLQKQYRPNESYQSYGDICKQTLSEIAYGNSVDPTLFESILKHTIDEKIGCLKAEEIKYLADIKIKSLAKYEYMNWDKITENLFITVSDMNQMIKRFRNQIFHGIDQKEYLMDLPTFLSVSDWGEV